MSGTSSYGISTPRSPRAIITASATSRIASNDSTAGRVSILATIAWTVLAEQPAKRDDVVRPADE